MGNANDHCAQAVVANSLIGQYFHSLSKTDGMVEWQGVVIGRPEPGWYLVQLLEWIMGEPSVSRLVKVEDMETWLFYENAESMNHSYEHGVAHKRREIPNACEVDQISSPSLQL